MKFAYTGPSWAASSFPMDSTSTNLAKQWALPYIDFSMVGSNVLQCIDRIKKVNKLPVIWIYNEPFGCLTEATGITKKQLIQRTDWAEIWEECNQFCLKQISSLNRPVLLIGGHSDIVNCTYPNITVGEKSWQKFLAKTAGMSVTDQHVYVKMDDGGDFTLKNCWGAELIHQFMHEHSEINPSTEITNAVWDMFFFWKELEKANLFYEVHPNNQGNKLFADFLKPIVTNFLQEIQ